MVEPQIAEQLVEVLTPFYLFVNSSPVVPFVVVSVCQQRQVCRVQTVQKVGDSTVPFAFRQCRGPDVQKTVVFPVAVFGQVGDMPFVVHDRCLEVPQVLFLRFDVTVITAATSSGLAHSGSASDSVQRAD